MNRTLPEETEFQTILIPVGGGQAWEKAIERGFSLADQLGAEVHLLFVVEKVLVDSAMYTADPGAIQSKLRKQAEETLNSLASDRSDLDITQAIRTGEPAQEIVEYADEAGVDLIVMATQGSRAITDVLIGSVTRSVVNGSKVPVMTIRVDE